MSLRVPTRADLEDKARLLDVLRGLYDAIGTNRYSLTQITNRLVNIEGATSDANVWLSQPNAGFPSGVNMGALGTGVLQQTVAAGVATPVAVNLPEHATLFGGPTGLLDYDAVSYYYLRADHMAGIANTDPAAIAGLAFVNDNGRGTGTDIPSSSYNVYTTGTTYSGISGMDNKLVFMAPNPGVVGYDIGFVWGMSGRRKMAIDWVGGGATDAITQVRIYNPDAASGAGYSHLQIDNNSTAKLALAVYGATHVDWPESAAVRAEGGPLRLQTGMTTTDRILINTTGTVDVSSLVGGGSDHLVYATDAAGRLSLVTIGSGLTFTGGTLSATGSGGTVTSVGATLPLTSTGGTTPVIALNYDGVTITLSGAAGTPIQRAALTGDISAPAGSNTTTLATVNASPGTYTYATVTVNAKGLATAVSSGAAPVLSVSGTAGRISSTGGQNPVLDLVTTAVIPGSYTFASITVDAYGRLTAASSGSTAGFVPTSRTLGATSPILIDGGNTPLDLSANRTFSHDTSGVSAATYDWATVQVDAYGHVTGAAANSWPTAGRVVVSTGTNPIGYAEFTYDTAKDALRNDGPLSLNCAPDSITAGHLITTDPTATRDRMWFGLGGVTVSDGVNREWVTLSPAGTTVNTAGISLLATLRVRATDYTLTGVAAGTIASVYADQPTFNGGNVSNPSNSAWVYYGAGGTTSQSNFEGTVIANSLNAAASVSVGAAGFHVIDTTGIKFFNVGAAIGVAQQTVTGSRVTGAALVSLLAAGAAYGLWVDATTP